jgi:hypothetical protein
MLSSARMVKVAIAATMTLFAASATVRPVLADTTYSGRAIGAYVNTVLTGPIYLSDTGDLPSSGGWQGACLLAAGVPSVLEAKVLVGATSGSHGKAHSSASLAEVVVLPGTPTELSAAFLHSQTQASCDGVKGSSEIASLTFCGQTIQVTGEPNQKVSLLGATLVINEQVITSSGAHHEIRVNAIHLLVPGVAEVVLSSAKSDVDCTSPGGHGPCYDFVTGGGWITGTPSGDRGNFGFNAGFKPNSTTPTVAFNYIDHNTGMHVQASTITLYKATSETGRHFEGACTVNGASGFKYWVDVEDNGEPGKDVDYFSISVSNGYKASGKLAGGNIQLHANCALGGLEINPGSVCGSLSTTGIVRLFAPAPAGGITVKLSSSNPAVASCQDSLTIPAGAVSATFAITTKIVTVKTAVKFKAEFEGEVKSATLNVQAAGLYRLTVSPSSVCGGVLVTGKVSLSCPSSVDIVVNLASSHPTIASCPTTVTIPAGQLLASFAIKTTSVHATTSVDISASHNGVVKTAVLTVKAPKLLSILCDPTSLIGGSSCLGKVLLDCPAPQGGITVNISVSLPGVALCPLSCFIPEGAISAVFTINTKPCAVLTSVTISATCADVTKTATLTIKATELLSLKLSTYSLLGGLSCIGICELNGPAPAGGITVKLTSSAPLIVLVPSSCFIPEGATSGKFDCKTTPVAALTSVVITATHGSITKSVPLQVKLF